MSVEIAPGVQYTGNTDDNSTVFTTGLGTLTTKGAQFQVVDAQGQLLAGDASFDDAPPAAGAPADASAQPIPATAQLVDDAAPNPQADFNAALGQAATQFGLATGVGGLVGGVAGAAVGCALGVATGGTLSALVSVGSLTPLGALGGCLLGGSTVGGIGTIVGGAAAGIPVGILSAVQAYNTLHAAGEA
ncbi:hypothetical protein [Nocardia sp. alder85J]|uniref:hypothetical protein n=1 Tax=Nocardia sp. alder85J TaxID=2862949 RepID=UPI001CD75142|nr:hypothetical protein [Nocardia sp. alder85J]MCX4096468.1 hypothetical protein [Nocardia sp. alder85J]